MGVIGRYRECFIHETPSMYIVTNEHGRTIGQSMTVPGCEGLIDEYRNKHPLQEGGR